MLVKMQCPHCGANMDVNDELDMVVCTYCGSKIANLKQKVEVTQNVNVSGVVKHVMDRSNDPNLIISYATTNPSVVMVVRIVQTGQKNTYLNGQTQTYHLQAGMYQIVLKIGKKNYERTIVIPADNSPVRINAAFIGRRAEITIDQPNVGYVQQQQVLRTNQNTGKRKQSTLAIISFILSLTGFGAVFGIPLAIWDLIRAKKDKDHAHGLAIAGVIIGSVFGMVLISSKTKSCNKITSRSSETSWSSTVWEDKTTELRSEKTSKPTATAKATPENTNIPTATAPTVAKTPKPTAKPVAAGIRPEFQKAMDEYREFFEEYCKFMKEYTKSPTVAMLTQYYEFLEQYEETMEAWDKLDTNDMTAEEYKLYLDTMNEINKMLMDLQ
jgi:DNA-directed RNA polymerase subunit RPC12/RpoP